MSQHVELAASGLAQFSQEQRSPRGARGMFPTAVRDHDRRGEAPRRRSVKGLKDSARPTASRATPTRDLQELVALGAMRQTRTLKSPRQYLHNDHGSRRSARVKAMDDLIAGDADLYGFSWDVAPGRQILRTGPEYWQTVSSAVSRVMPSSIDCAISILSNGSLWIGGNCEIATACSLVTASSR